MLTAGRITHCQPELRQIVVGVCESRFATGRSKVSRRVENRYAFGIRLLKFHLIVLRKQFADAVTHADDGSDWRAGRRINHMGQRSFYSAAAYKVAIGIEG